MYGTNTTPSGYGANPEGWFSLSGTPDVSNIYGWWGLTDWFYPIDNPPNGDTVWVTAYSTEKSGTNLTDLMIGVEYTISFYMAELSTYADGSWPGGTLSIGLGGETYLYPFVGGLDAGWSAQTLTFVATSTTMMMSFGYDEPASHQWNVSMDSIIFACDTLDTYASALDICEGDEITLTSVSLNGGSVTWDGGVIDGEPFIPPAGTHYYTATSDHPEDCNSAIEINVYSYPDVEVFVDDSIVCEGDPVIFSIDGDGGIYDWTPDGIIVGYPFYPELGTTEVTLSVTNVICETIKTVELTVLEPPVVNALVSDTVICEGESVVFTGEGTDIFNWDSGIINGELFTLEFPGINTYVLEGVDTASGCTAMDSVEVMVLNAPAVIANADDEEICIGDLVTLTGSGASDYVWNLGVTDGEAFEPPPGTTIYTVVGTDENGCQDSTSISISAVECIPITAGFVLPESACQNDCISIEDTTIAETEIISWEWDFGTAFEPNSSTLQHPIICPNEVGTHTIALTATSEEGAVSTLSKEIIIHETPLVEIKQDTIIEYGNQAELVAISPSSGSYEWSPSYLVDCTDCPEIFVTPNQDQIYVVTLIDSNGCKGIDSATVLVNLHFGIGVPTAFSPNNDGNNDQLFVKGKGLESIHFFIYNRYGQLVFETSDQSLGWDGTFENEDLNPGVFTWVLEYTRNGETGMLKGNTTLVK